MTTTENCTINRVAASIPFNAHAHPTIIRDPNMYPRYTIRSHAGLWEITDHYQMRQGHHCVQKIHRRKAEWDAEDIYSFVEHLNSR